MPDLTLATLRTALARAHGPAVERLTDRTPEGIAAAYLPRVIWTEREPAETGWAGAVWSDQIDMLGRHKTVGALRLDLTDPGTVHAVLVALCLALGYDCGQRWGDGAPLWGVYGLSVPHECEFKTIARTEGEAIALAILEVT